MNENNEASIPDSLQKELSLEEKPKVDKSSNRKFLEGLPRDVRDDLDTFMRAKNPSAARNYMMKKYGQQYPPLLKLTKVAYYNYETKFKIKEIDLALKTQVMNTPPELLSVIQNFTDSSISIGDKKAALESLFKDCADTSKRLELSQQNFLDPQMQIVIIQNRKVQITIIEKLAVLKNQLDQDSSRNLSEAFEEVIQVCLAAVVNSYKVVHQDQALYSKYMADLLTRLNESMKTYRVTKEVVKQIPIKIN
jgi:hypothetical protein